MVCYINEGGGGLEGFLMTVYRNKNPVLHFTKIIITVLPFTEIRNLIEHDICGKVQHQYPLEA